VNQIPEPILTRFKSGELVAAIAQSATDKKVLMLAWMNEESLSKTIETGYATYWSRSRNQLWKKGETSGNLQEVEAISYDCDADTILLKVKQAGPACHTGEESCFHNPIDLRNK
jgi:phosphoribosyl-AMP cyclohydrolase